MSNPTINNAKLFLRGFYTFKKTGQTPFKSYIALRDLFVRTNGRLNDWCANIFKITRRKLKNIKVNGVLGTVSNDDIKEIANQIEENGYYIFPQKLSDDIVNDIYQFCL